jgi:glyoxylase-like metal-dependent hydrolase (beta-lactamase superfamily II)
MDAPQLLPTQSPTRDLRVLPAALPVPGLGWLPANAFLLKARQPVLVDTGLLPLQADLIDALATEIDLADLRWIWLTHADPDHTGALARLMELAPQATLACSFLCLGKLQLGGFAPGRVQVMAPGDRLDLGDRELAALVPPWFDAPETLSCYDARSGALFCADAFAALGSGPETAIEASSAGALAEGLRTWTAIDVPWLAQVGPERFARMLASIDALGPRWLLSSHLAPAAGLGPSLRRAATAAQHALQQAMAEQLAA